jgi:hypothetical protein
MSLMTLVRLFAVVVLGWTLVALGIGAMGGGSLPHPSPVPPSAEPPRQGSLPSFGLGSNRHNLVDLATGGRKPLHLPEEDQWTNVAISPWTDVRDDVEVLGRWVSRGEGAFCGMGSFRLSDGAVISRVPMEILPTGRPCWVPGQPRTILFPAGDGHLYRCHLPAGEVVAGVSLAAEDGAGQMSLVPVTWKVPVPGIGGVLLTDPIWSSDLRLRKWVIVSLSRQDRRGPQAVFEPAEIWWLELGDQAESILAAGRLTVPEAVGPNDTHREEQHPTVAVGPGGTLRLVYLKRRKCEKSARLYSAELDFESGTGRPYLAPGREGSSRIRGEGLGLAPLLVSSDGMKVFGLDVEGQVHAYSLAGKTD